METDKSDSLLVAATNRQELLGDSALCRRFDVTLQYRNPNAELAARAMENRLAPFSTSDLDFMAMGEAAEGLSFAEIVKACEEAAKEMVMKKGEHIDPQCLRRAIQARRNLHHA